MSAYSPMNENLSTEITIRKRNGLPVQYSCPYPQSANTTTVSYRSDADDESVLYELRSIEIKYAYEFAILGPNESIDEVIIQDLESLEYTFLYLVAKATSLLKCNFDSQNIILWDSDTIQEPRSQVPYLVSLSSDPDDEVSDVGGKLLFRNNHHFYVFLTL